MCQLESYFFSIEHRKKIFFISFQFQNNKEIFKWLFNIPFSSVWMTVGKKNPISIHKAKQKRKEWRASERAWKSITRHFFSFLLYILFVHLLQQTMLCSPFFLLAVICCCVTHLDGSEKWKEKTRVAEYIEYFYSMW